MRTMEIITTVPVAMATRPMLLSRLKLKESPRENIMKMMASSARASMTSTFWTVGKKVT